MSRATHERLGSPRVRTRVAAPDETSGVNPNTPIRLYDLKPNALFDIGSEVIHADAKVMPFRGTVLGHCAEDRVWVQWGGKAIQQEDTDDIIPLQQYAARGVSSMESPVSQIVAGRNASRVFRLAFGNQELDPEIESLDDEIFDTLPQEQDSQDTIDEENNNKFKPENSPESNTVTILDMNSLCQDNGDHTESIEDHLRESSRREALFGLNRNKQPINQIRKLPQYKGMSDSDLYMNYNIFQDPELTNFFKQHGLSDAEINNFSTLRQHQLNEYKKQYSKPDPRYGPVGVNPNKPRPQWGQGTGVKFNIKGRSGPSAPAAQPGGVAAPGTAQSAGPVHPSSPLFGKPGFTQNPAGGTWQPPRPVPSTNRAWSPYMGASRASSALRHHSHLIGGLLGMTRTAALVRQAADVADAVNSTVHTEQDIDETVTAAVKNATRDLLIATDHLRQSPNIIAVRVADKLEQDFASSLAIPLGV